jgi:FkbM family methyltransferase
MIIPVLSSLVTQKERTLKSLVKSVIRHIPQQKKLIAMGAALPPSLRSSASMRLFSFYVTQPGVSGLIQTNMGISKSYKCLLPYTHSMELFGKPEFYKGERAPLKLAALLSQSSDAFVDIGSHVGYYVFYLRNQLTSARPIYYFEPDPDLYSLIERNVTINSLPNVHGFRKAIGSYDGSVRFWKNLTDPLSGSINTPLSETHSVTPIDVDILRFASFAEQAGFQHACVKVDVEGAEKDFVAGAEAAFGKINYLIMEVLKSAHDNGFVRQVITDYGFHAYYINDFRLEYSRDGSFIYHPPEYNWLFCRETPAQLRNRLMSSAFSVSG